MISIFLRRDDRGADLRPLVFLTPLYVVELLPDSEAQLVPYRFAGETRWTLMNNE